MNLLRLMLATVVLVACGDSETFLKLEERDRFRAMLDGSVDAMVTEGGVLEGGTMEGGMIVMPPPNFDDPFGAEAGVFVYDGDLVRPDGAPYPLALPDGAVVFGDGSIELPDGEVIDFETARERYDDPDKVDVFSCDIGQEDRHVVGDLAFAGSGAFDLAAGPTGWGLSYRVESCGKADALMTMRIDASDPFMDAQPVLDECRQIEDIALGWTDEAGWQVAWTDNSTNSIELHRQALDEDLALDGMRQPVTNAPESERAPVLANIVGRPMLAWISEDLASGKRTIWTEMLGGDGPLQAVPASEGHQPVTLTAAQIGPESAAIAWVEEVANRGIWLQRLDADGGPVGKPIQLTPYAAGGSTVDLATRAEDGGAAIYAVGIDDVNFEVRFRRLDETGKPIGEESKVVSRPEQGVGASAVRVGGGYAVAYRALRGGEVDSPQVRLVFVSKEGNVLRDTKGRLRTVGVSDAERDGSAVDIALSIDGSLLLGYVDGNTTTGNMLHLIRRSLSCG